MVEEVCGDGSLGAWSRELCSYTSRAHLHSTKELRNALPATMKIPNCIPRRFMSDTSPSGESGERILEAPNVTKDMNRGAKSLQLRSILRIPAFTVVKPTPIPAEACASVPKRVGTQSRSMVMAFALLANCSLDFKRIIVAKIIVLAQDGRENNSPSVLITKYPAQATMTVTRCITMLCRRFGSLGCLSRYMPSGTERSTTEIRLVICKTETGRRVPGYADVVKRI